MHVVIPFLRCGGGICSTGPIISKIPHLGNGANIFAKTASTGPGGGLLLRKPQSLQSLGTRASRAPEEAVEPRTIVDNTGLDFECSPAISLTALASAEIVAVFVPGSSARIHTRFSAELVHSTPVQKTRSLPVSQRRIPQAR